jgi:hypothetical protein
MSDIENQIIPQATGFGLKGFEDAGHFNQMFLDDLEKMKTIDKSVDSLATQASLYVQDRTYKKSYDTQMSELSWFEKNIHLNSAKEKQLLDARNKKAQSDAFIVEMGISIAAFAFKLGTAYVAGRNRKVKFAETAYQILAYISATNNQIKESDQTVIRSVMESMNKSGIISDKKRKQIPQNKIPSKILEIDDCDSLPAFREFIGSNAYKILHEKYSDDLILKEKRPIFEIIGFQSHHELKDFIGSTHDDYLKLQAQNGGYQLIMQSLFNDASCAFNRSRENCIQNSILLSAYDPFKETRQKNIQLIKQGGQIAGEIAIGTQQGGHPAVVTAFVLSKHLLVANKDKNANELLHATYEKSLVKKGLDKNEALNLIKQGEALYKSVHS